MHESNIPPAVQQWLHERGIDLSPNDLDALRAESFSTAVSFRIHTDGEPSRVELVDDGSGDIAVLIGDRAGALYSGPVTAPAGEVGGIVRAMAVSA
jgi:hypothetical protein